MNNLQEIRKSKGLSVKQVATDLAVSRMFIDRCERGDKVSFEKMQDYAHYLDTVFVPVEIGKSAVITRTKDGLVIDLLDGTVINCNDDRLDDLITILL